VRKGKDINITYETEGYLFQSENINVPKESTHGEMTKKYCAAAYKDRSFHGAE